MKTLKELRELSGMTRTQFAEYFDIPYRTIQDWELGNRECKQYFIDLMEYKLRKEEIIQNEGTGL
jgi:DNA-binding transcriptional regulator YiaG